jgi:protein-tyrosine-phosphatase
MKALFVCVENAGRSQRRWAAATPGPVLPAREYLDWNLPDPAGLCLEEVRELRAVIEDRVARLPI